MLRLKSVRGEKILEQEQLSYDFDFQDLRYSTLLKVSKFQNDLMNSFWNSLTFSTNSSCLTLHDILLMYEIWILMPWIGCFEVYVEYFIFSLLYFWPLFFFFPGMQNLSADKSAGTPVNVRGKPYHLLIGNRKNMQLCM